MHVDVSGNLNYFRDEIVRRDGERLNQRMLAFTKWVVVMTVAILVLTALNVALVAAQIIRG